MDYQESGIRSRCRRIGSELWAFRQTFFIICTPLLLLPLPLAIPTQPAYCGYILLLMAIWWVSEALPISVTSLVPLFGLPLLGVVPAGQVCLNYMKNANVLFLGGITVAIAIERWNLHKRIAFRILLVSGSKPIWLMLGFMLVTWFLSMWISNTATTAMMIPVIQAVLDQLDPANTPDFQDVPETPQDGAVLILEPTSPTLNEEKSLLGTTTESDIDDISFSNNKRKSALDYKDLEASMNNEALNDNNTYDLPYETEEATKGDRAEFEVGVPEEKCLTQEEKDFINITKGMNICVCFAANIGGVATLTGTAPNLVLQEYVTGLYKAHDKDDPISFTGWMAFGLPFASIAIVLCWIWLQLFFFGIKQSVFGFCFRKKGVQMNDSRKEEAVKSVLRKEYEKLGPMSFAEWVVLTNFLILAALWLTRDPRFVPGWGTLFKKGFVTDSTVSILICVLLFICPSRRPTFFCCRRYGDTSPSGPVEPLLDWETVWHKFPWGVLILVGGGFALADGAKVSGLSAWISNLLVELGSLPPWLMVMVLSFAVSMMTQVTSNTAITTLMLPILADLAAKVGLHPLYIMIPATVAASCAFMLPVATPPNAIVYAYGKITVMDMIKAGSMTTIIGVLVITLSICTFGRAIFQTDVLPWPITTHINTTYDQPWLNSTV
ncbi:unnamed protein product, partial [Owenia fusiformis]